MKKILFAIPMVAAMLTACDPSDIDLGSPDAAVSADDLLKGFSYSQYDEESLTTKTDSGNYFTYTTSPARPVEILTVDAKGDTSIIGHGSNGTFKIVPKRGNPKQQSFIVRVANQDGTKTDAVENVFVHVPSELTPEMRFLVSDNGSKVWKWDTEFRSDGGAWGNMGYTPGDGDSFASSGNGVWWGGSPNILNTPEQLKNAPGGQPQGDASTKAYMVFNEDGTTLVYDSLGNVIRNGKFEMQGYDGSRHASKNGEQASWSLGTLHTDAGSIMWPFKINGGGEEPTDFEVMQLDVNHLKLIYAADGTGSWSEATWWAFKSESDAIGALTDYGSKDWTWDVDWRSDGGAWGNMGYAPGDGDSFANSGNGIWWACAPADLSGQLQHAGDDQNGAKYADPNAFMTINWKAGTITSFDASGNQISSGSYEIQDWGNGNRNISTKDGSQSQWALGKLYTPSPCILWPYAINKGGFTPQTFEIMQLDANHLKLIYAADGTTAWSEASWWAFKPRTK